MAELRIIDPEKKFKEDIKENKTFVITTKYDYFVNMTSPDLRRKNTIYSRRYGIVPGDDKDVLDYMYTCKCEGFRGQIKLGMTCPDCNTKVEKREYPLNTFGYMILPFKAPTILGMQLIADIMSGNNFNSLINSGAKFRDLYTDLDNIINDYGKSNKAEKIKFIKEYKELLFSTHVPVISAKLRPIAISVIGKSEEEPDLVSRINKRDKEMEKNKKGGTKKAHKVEISSFNVQFTQLSMAIENYNECIRDNVTDFANNEKKHIYSILNNIYNDSIQEGFGSKKRIARDGICSIRFPYTSVAVLAPLPDYNEMDSCTIPFGTFRAVFQEEIKYLLINVFGIDKINVNRIININRILTPREKEMVVKCFDLIENKYIYINRQPTIDWGSILVLKIREIRDELVLRVHALTLKELRGDFDGDAPHMVGLDKSIRKEFHDKFSPKAHVLMWDKSFNNNFGLINDYQALFFISMDDNHNPEVNG